MRTVLSWLTATQSELACAQRLVDAKTGPSRIAMPTVISDPLVARGFSKCEKCITNDHRCQYT